MKRILLISLLAIGELTQAQNGYTAHTASLNLSGITLRESALLVDNTGNKWIGFSALGTPTANVGLVKHNGSTWTVYTTTTTPALPSNYITALAKDASNNIWIGSRAGLTKFDGTNFITYNTTNGLASNTITCIETNGTQVYVGTNAGLSRFDGTNFANYNVANGKLPNDTITAIKAENANTIWLGGNKRLVQFGIDNTLSTTSYTNNTSTGGKVNCIYVDANATKWIGSNSLFQFSNNTFTNVKDIYHIIGSDIPSPILDISAGLNNGIAFRMKATGFGTSSIGIMELAPNNKVYQYFAPPSNSYNTIGDYIENNGTDLVVSKNGYSFTSSITILYYGFNKTTYEMPLLQVNSNNFKYLDINNVKAGIANLSDMHLKIDAPFNDFGAYEVPKGSGNHSILASALWIGGIDNVGQLHGGAQTFRQNGTDFWPGPLDTTVAITNTMNAKNYDKIWKISYTDINNFITNFNTGNVQNGSYITTEDILTWPAKGTGNYSRNLAPFVDVNNNGIYDPTVGGDYPKIKGDQALYFIYNDHLLDSTHKVTSCLPMGIEVHAMAYAYGCSSNLAGKPELGLTTFYDYKIINRSTNTYSNTYISMFSDVDLGNFNDDYIGCNVKDAYGYAYNGDSFDEDFSGTNGYQAYPPTQGIAILKSPVAKTDGIDNDFDGTIDEPNEEMGMTKFTYFNQNTDPSNCTEYRNYMTGFWKDNTPFTCGGNAYGGPISTNWVYSGDPNGGLSTDPNNTCGNWTETTAGNIASDRRFIVGTGPFTFAPNQMQEVEYAFVTSFDSTSATNANLLSVAKLKTDVQKIKSFYNQTSIPNCLQAITIGVNEVLNQNHILMYPNPANSIVYIKNNLLGEATIKYDVLDVLGKIVVQNTTSKNEFSINIADLKTGIYFVRLNINNNTVIKKLVKE